MKGRAILLFSLIIAACSSGITAQTTVCENATVADIVFLVDGSSRIGSFNFQYIRSFLRDVIKSLDIGSKKVRIGVAQYGGEPPLEFLLNDHTTRKSLLTAVEKIPYREGGKEIGKAIDYLRMTYFTEDAGSRPQIAVVITDGDSSDDVIAPAKRLKEHGVLVFGVGVGGANQKELESITNLPSQRFLSSIDSYQDLGTLKDNLLKTVCETMEAQRQALANRFEDIFFLVDSGISQGQLKIFKNDLVNLIDELNVSASTYRVGLAQYGQDTQVEFLLNAYQTKQQTQNAVKRFSLRPQRNQPRNLGSALQYANTHFFTREAGSRVHQGLPQTLVVVSGKKSDDSVSREALKVRSAGVTVYGMSAGASMEDIDLFASPRYAFDTPRVLLLKEFFLKKKDNVTEDCKGANVADIVFIVDESGSIGTPNFQLVLTFLHSIVSGLDVSPSKVQVGIVMYNTQATARAYLNTFSDKDSILQYIKILPYHGGGTNTGAALNFTLDKILTEKKGSRKEKGVQQVVVVITDGKSQDNVSEAALNLRRANITVYAVGIGQADKAELMVMASHPPDRHVFTVNNFTELTPLKHSLRKILCENLINQAIKVNTRRTDVKQACVQKNEADIYFLMDDSGSIDNVGFQEMKDFIIKFLQTFDIGSEHVRVGLVKYADKPTPEFELTTHSDAETLKKAVNDISHDGGGTETGKALEFMGPRFAMASRDYKVPKYLIVITDGESTDEVKAPAEKLRSQDIIIYAIGVKESNETQLLEIAGDPKRNIFVNNFEALKFINDDIITDICSEDACRDVQGDIFFLTVSSESISEEDFQKMKKFMKSVISKFPIGQNKVHVGVMQFSTKYKLELPLHSSNSIDDISNAIDKMQQMREGTDIGKAITEVSQYFDATRGGRPDLSQRLIVITDRQSRDEVKGPAEALRAKGVVVYAIGLVEAKTTQLVEISGSKDRVYAEKDFDALKDLESQVALDVCKKECNIDQADIIFLVDSSTSIDSSEYESMRKFMESIVNQTTVGEDRTRFGLISFADEPQSHFTLNSSYSKRRVLTAIPNVKPSGLNTYIGKALEYSLQFFNIEAGGRKGLNVPQMLMVITDGAATNPHNLKEPSDALRRNGVTVVSIGVKKAERNELMIMAGNDTSKVFQVDNFEGLETLYTNVSSALCIKPACKKADLVFLLDRSGSINLDQYKLMIDFTIDVVNSFDVGEEFVHVGLAQFSEDPKDEFYLNKYIKKEECISHIRNMKYKGGSTNIGRALNRTKHYFEVSQGSRTGIPKNLVLISDGDSHDDVEDTADVLRALGIEVFAIGVGDVHVLQLLQITGTPERLFSVGNFNGLVNIKQKVVNTMCDDPNPPTPPPTPPPPPPPSDCSIDIAMGFDVSGARGEMLISGHPNLKTFLPWITNSVSSLKSLCCVGPAPVRTNIAFRVVGRDGRSRDDFKFEGYSGDVVNKVMTLTLTEPTYFNTALLKSFGEKFKTESKARVKVLVIFSDGLDDDVMKLEQESELLRQSGVSALLTVALEGVHDPAQLQMVEFGRGFDYKVPLSIGMQSVSSTILKLIDSVSDRECCNVCKCSGHEGAPGSPGPPGSKGPSGSKGQLGFPGDEGGAGERGPAGPGGPQGIEGCSGPRGHKGYRGVSGNRGDDGEDALEGVNGEQGLTGPDGARGDRGDPGNTGIPGIRGEAGLKGERGLRGDPGEPGADNTSPGAKGEPGNPGLPGLSGLNGEPGDDGGTGDPGLDGRRGLFGEKGIPGIPGDPGLQGNPGASGPQGRRGKVGDRGPKGVSGFPGPQGGPGPAGGPGLEGRRGANGQKGQPGEPGVKGALGSVGPRGMPGQDGRDGYGSPAPKGAKGEPGFPGYPGLLGEDGQGGTEGYPGPKGNRGRSGNSGGPGESGGPGDPGHPGHRGPRGPPGDKHMTECQLITYIRDNCVCYHGGSGCPAYPTELVFGLDMSADVTPVAFERQRSALLTLLEDITISENNCPTGARVAVVGYSAYTKYLIRFEDYRRKAQLIESVKNIALEKTSNQRHLGAAMRFVGQNVFKRIRSGLMMRKVAVFFSYGPSQVVDDIVTAMMVYRGLNIVPVVISLRSAPAIGRALEVDDSGRSMFMVLGRNMTADLKKVQNCAICYDPCRRLDQCAFIQDPAKPQEVDVDLVMVADSSREMQADEFAGVQQLLGSVVEQLAVSPQPRRAGNNARVALVQQSGTQVTEAEFGLGTYQNSNLMRRHLTRNMTLQGGSSALGQTLEFTLKEVLLKASQPRKKRALLAVVGTQTAYEDRAKLRYISQKAKCEGVALFVVTVGERYDRTQVEELASLPIQQHLIHVGRLKADEQGYAQRFFRVFLSALAKGMNPYPPPSIKQTCDQLTEPDEAEIFNFQDGGQGSANQQDEALKEQEEEFREQTGGRTQSRQLDVFNSVTIGDGQSFLSADHLHDPDILMKPSVFISTDACLLSQDAGSCHNYSLMWFYDSEQGRCSRFWYGGCGGNGNRFHTHKDCEKLCLTKSRLGAGGGGGAGGGERGAAPGEGAAGGGGRGAAGGAAGEGRTAAGATGRVPVRRRRLKKTVAFD
ncbi:collagen alpha-6(VI) chain-like isoform X2 [Sebastes fasciatus]|uniref:collagen alpha-6(VI) chain-like isoform X2 n=1 Tax=Sebastes fasciatus TaxID=394691 RepID=UPI003D9E7352